MSPTPLLLNVEPLVGGYLKDISGVKALEARVVSKTPGTTEKAWVRVTLLDPRNKTRTRRVEHIVSYYLQLDCYAGNEGGRDEAFRLAAAVRAGLVDMPETQPLPDVVVSDVQPGSMSRLPDSDLGGRERFVLDIEVWMHS
jgi:hypothetical protein